MTKDLCDAFARAAKKYRNPRLTIEKGELHKFEARSDTARLYYKSTATGTTFELIRKSDETFNLRALNSGRFLSCTGYGRMTANRVTAKSWELFKIKQSRHKVKGRVQYDISCTEWDKEPLCFDNGRYERGTKQYYHYVTQCSKGAKIKGPYTLKWVD